ncbi:hypothetical protein GQ457_04G033440 [Hibiscus cannabinus]
MPKHGKLPPFFLSALLITTIFTLFILYSPYPLNPISKPGLHQSLALLHPPSPTSSFHGDDDGDILSCDLFKGEWMPDPHGSLFSWNLFMGKKLAFIGDSVARNHMESLLCLLSKVESPIDRYKDSDDRNRIWYFPGHEFTLMILWTKFLVHGEERVINGSSSGIFDLHLHKVDEKWSKDLPAIDYIIISDAHWFFRTIYLNDDTGVVGCVYCDTPNSEGDPSADDFAGSFRERDMGLGRKMQLDVTRAMLMRPDGHPGEFWGNKWMQGHNDCVHWCLSGPIDVWNDFLMPVLKREA